MADWLYGVALLAAGFALGRARLDSLVNWAEDWTSPGWRTWRFWLALPIAVTVLALVWIARPRRTLANVRSWRAGERFHPVPQYDPEWAAKRTGDAS